MANADVQKCGLSADEIAACLHEPDSSTEDFIMQQTMMRVKDPKKSLQFYSQVLGMRLLHHCHFPSMNFSLYFMGYADVKDIPAEKADRGEWAFKQPGTIELTHNWGSESDDTKYHNGNDKPQGFGHIGIAVPDVYAACERFDKYNVEYVKKPDGGKMKGLAFIKDPDGYWIEILNPSMGRGI